MLLTKLHIPQTGENIIHRNNLFEKLDEGLKRKLILVSATAGYGKTTLISNWINKNKLPTAWYSLDERDNDPYEFLSFIIHGIQKTHPEIGKNSLDFLKTPGTAGMDYIIELLINDLLKVQNELILVLDDLHLIQNKQIFELLSFIIEYKPKHFHVVLSTRSDPPLPFARLRSQHEIVEIRSSDLTFSKRDITELFNKKLSFGLNHNDIDLLRLKTEGWIAGLQLTALTFQGHHNISAYIEKIAGDHRYIMDYLMEEILNIQNEEMREFLLCTSILEKMSGSLCDAMLEKKNSQLLLELLEKSNMFIIPLDDERQWFRYHHLFRDLLQQRLVLQFKNKIPDLHNKASLWFENNELILFAIEHAIKSEDKKRALRLISSTIDELWATSHYAIILKFGNIFSTEDLLSNPTIGIIYAWVIAVFGRLEEAENLLNTILKETTDTSLLGRVYETFNFIKVFNGDTESAFKYSELAIQNISKDDIIWSAWAHVSHGESHLLRMELSECIHSLEQASKYAVQANSMYLRLISESKIAYNYRLKGKYNIANKYCNNLLKDFSSLDQKSNLRTNILSGVLYATKGVMQAEKNQVEEGIKLSKQGYEYAKKLLSISFKTYIAVVLAETYYKAGFFKESYEILNEIESNLKSRAVKWTNLIAYVVKVKLLIQFQDDEKLEDEIRLKSEHGKNFAFERCFENLALLRYYLYKKKYDEAIAISNIMCEELKEEGVYELLSEVELVKAKVYLKKNKSDEAVQSVIKAIHYTQDEELIRTFIAEGEEIYQVIKEIKKLKSIKSDELLHSISSEFLNKLIKVFESEKKHKLKDEDDMLSNRELDTLKLISKNLTNREIADQLYISITTVKTHVRNILLKLEAKDRNDAVLKAKEKGIL